MKLEKFTKNKNQKRIIIGSIIVLVLLVGGITLYRTFALYEEKKEFNVLKGRVPDFREKVLFSNYILEQTEIDSSIEKFEHEETKQTKALTDYRYVGKNPNNYVYFGCEDTCTNENLYRIIGLIPTQSIVGGEYENRVKLIKASNYEERKSGLLGSSTFTKSGYGYRWNNINSNVWGTSSLNTQVLNGIYWDNLGEYRNYISPSVWYLGAITASSSYDYAPDEFYIYERSNTQCYSKGALNYINNIGLMYPSDYGYSLGNSYRNVAQNTILSVYTSAAWLNIMGNNRYFEWTISSDNLQFNATWGPYAWHIGNSGLVECRGVNRGEVINGIRPTFYLKSGVLYKSGDGSIEEPYRIAISD